MVTYIRVSLVFILVMLARVPFASAWGVGDKFKVFDEKNHPIVTFYQDPRSKQIFPAKVAVGKNQKIEIIGEQEYYYEIKLTDVDRPDRYFVPKNINIEDYAMVDDSEDGKIVDNPNLIRYGLEDTAFMATPPPRYHELIPPNSLLQVTEIDTNKKEYVFSVTHNAYGKPSTHFIRVPFEDALTFNTQDIDISSNEEPQANYQPEPQAIYRPEPPAVQHTEIQQQYQSNPNSVEVIKSDDSYIDAHSGKTYRKGDFNGSLQRGDRIVVVQSTPNGKLYDRLYFKGPGVMFYKESNPGVLLFASQANFKKVTGRNVNDSAPQTTSQPTYSSVILNGSHVYSAQKNKSQLIGVDPRTGKTSSPNTSISNGEQLKYEGPMKTNWFKSGQGYILSSANDPNKKFLVNEDTFYEITGSKVPGTNHTRQLVSTQKTPERPSQKPVHEKVQANTTPEEPDTSDITSVPQNLPDKDPNDKEILLLISKDRCKKGVLKFDIKNGPNAGIHTCGALARGYTAAFRPKDKDVSSYNSEDKTTYKKGYYSNGEPCYYRNEIMEGGATPIPGKTFKKNESRTGSYKVKYNGSSKNKKWSQGTPGFALYPMGRVPVTKGDDSPPPGRSDLMIHDVSRESTRKSSKIYGEGMEKNFTLGCVRVTAACTRLIKEWFDEQEGEVKFTIEETAQ